MEEKQVLTKVHFEQLKNIKGLELELSGKSITGIFGPNGYGKSTLLHALLCLYQSQKGGEDHRFSEFFKTDDEFDFKGSKITMFYSYDDRGRKVEKSKVFHKRSDHWIHGYNERPSRPVFFIGVDSCVPSIEREKDKHQLINTTPDTLKVIANKDEIINAASFIMNRQYADLFWSKSRRNATPYLNVELADHLKYKSLNMGAGEQRMFKILQTVYNAPTYSLIIIDEIDLTMHTAALSRLVDKLVQRADSKHLQIVFTSHREELTRRKDINVRHIFQTKEGTRCLNQSTPSCIDRLTGSATRTMEVFVEDDLAEAIINRCTKKRNVSKRVQVHTFGSAANAFVIAAALHIMGTLSDNTLIVIDGDKYVTDDEKQTQINNAYSGNEPDKPEKRAEALKHISQFNLPAGKAPERYLWENLCSSVENNEITEAARAIHAVDDTHEYLDRIIDELGIRRAVALDQIVGILSEEPFWNHYVEPIMQWIDERISLGRMY